MKFHLIHISINYCFLTVSALKLSSLNYIFMLLDALVLKHTLTLTSSQPSPLTPPCVIPTLNIRMVQLTIKF